MPVITKKGQVTIPKDMRDSLHIKEGDSIEFELRDTEVVIRKLERKSILGLGGMLKNMGDRPPSRKKSR